VVATAEILVVAMTEALVVVMARFLYFIKVPLDFMFQVTALLGLMHRTSHINSTYVLTQIYMHFHSGIVGRGQICIN